MRSVISVVREELPAMPTVIKRKRLLPPTRRRVLYVMWSLQVCLLVIAARLAGLGLAKAQPEPVRGRIFDSHGVLLAESHQNSDHQWTRSYFQGQAFAPLIGHWGKSLSVTGLEETENESLSSGHDLTLTVDATVQHQVWQLLRYSLEQSPCDWVGLIAMEPHTGRILCCCTVEASEDVVGAPKMGPGWNPLMNGGLEPGSTLKPFIIAGALEAGVVAENDLISPSADDGKSASSPAGLSLEQILAYSDNRGAVAVASRLGEHETLVWLDAFGLTGNTQRVVHRKADAFGIEAMVLGESELVKPVQLLSAYCSLVNGGNYVTPQWTAAPQPSDSHRVISEKTSLQLRRMLLSVTDYGTARGIHNDVWPILGKTGTVRRGGDAAGRDLAWFVGFTPPQDPQVGILVVVQSAREKSYRGGGISAGLAEQAFDLLHHYF